MTRMTDLWLDDPYHRLIEDLTKASRPNYLAIAQWSLLLLVSGATLVGLFWLAWTVGQSLTGIGGAG